MSLHALNRRRFLESAATVTAATVLTSRLGWAAAEHKIEKIGLQLYTVRDLMKTDFDGTIDKVAQIGYKEVEFAGYFGHPGEQVRAACEKNGLSPVSTHIQYDELDDKFAGIDATVLAGGHTHLQMLRRFGESMIVNPGSVGQPFSQWSPRQIRVAHWAEYAVIDIAAERVGTELRRVPYDLDRLLGQLTGSGMPHARWWIDSWSAE